MKQYIVLTALFIGKSIQQTYADNPAAWASFSGAGSVLCNGSFSQANGSGIFHIDPNVPQGALGGTRNETNGDALPIGAGVTITQRNSQSTIEYSLWLSTNGANYSNDLALGYDVCGFGIGPLPVAVNARGQTDDGTCLTTLQEPCIDALQSLVESTALSLTLVTTPNLTYNSLPSVCQSITHTLNSNLPQECSSVFLNSTQIVETVPLTRYNTSQATIINPSCQIYDGFQSYSILGTATGKDGSAAVYDALAHTIVPILLVWMPVANADRTGFYASSSAKVACPHINTYSEGSRIPAPINITSTTNSTSSNSTSNGTSSSEENRGLSGGAIGGIVVGIIAILAILAIGIWFAMRRKKAQKTKNVHELGHNSYEGGDQNMLFSGNKETAVVSEMDDLGSARNELPPRGRWSQVPNGGRFVEMEGHGPTYEMRGTDVAPQELSDSARTGDRKSMRYEMPG